MKPLLIYLLESTICMGMLFFVYWLFLRKETFFMPNRIYLLMMMIGSLLLPLIPLHWFIADQSLPVVVLLEPVMITPEKMVQAVGSSLPLMQALFLAWLAGVVFLFFRFMVQLMQLFRMTRKSGISVHHGVRVVRVDTHCAPFSFFNLLFINEKEIPPATLSTIIRHERVHMRQMHSLDLLLMEFATMLQWFNPLVWIVAREVKSIHEFLADEGVLQDGFSRFKYQQMILDESMGIRVNKLTNHFNVSILKKRVAMMTKSKSNAWARSKMLLALPVLLGLFFLLTTSSYSSQVKPKQEIQEKKSKPVATDQQVYQKVEKEPTYPGGDEARMKFMIENIKYPAEAIKNKIQGKVFVTFIIRANGSVTDAKILRGIGGGCDEEALRVIKLMPKWNPGENKGKPVDVQFNLPIKFALDSGKKEEPKK